MAMDVLTSPSMMAQIFAKNCQRNSRPSARLIAVMLRFHRDVMRRSLRENTEDINDVEVMDNHVLQAPLAHHLLNRAFLLVKNANVMEIKFRNFFEIATFDFLLFFMFNE